MNAIELERLLSHVLYCEKYQDYAPNGLQVEGKTTIEHVVCGVTASMELIEKAIAANVDAMLVHHGYFWKGESSVITGMKYRRVKALLANDINLYAYHLPLDGHETLGNNAMLAQYWAIDNAAPIAPYDLVWSGELPNISLSTLSERISTTLGREPLVISGGEHSIKKVFWCSGGGQGFLERAAELGADAYISGEVSEKTYHEAKEYGVHYIAAGHHATERGGVMALADYLNKNTALNCQFIDCYNPV